MWILFVISLISGNIQGSAGSPGDPIRGHTTGFMVTSHSEFTEQTCNQALNKIMEEAKNIKADKHIKAFCIKK